MHSRSVDGGLTWTERLSGRQINEIARDPEVPDIGVRIETVVTGASDPLHAIVRALEARFPQDLRRWPHDKLATGLALRRIFEAGGLDPLVRADSSLRPEGYAAIDRELREHGA